MVDGKTCDLFHGYFLFSLFFTYISATAYLPRAAGKTPLEMAERQVPALPGSCPPYSYRSLYYDRPKGATAFDPIFYPND